MIDLSAPIVPGKEAGGIALSSSIEELLRETSIGYRTQVRRDDVIFLFDNIWIYTTKDMIVFQIDVFNEYMGSLYDEVKIGTPIMLLHKKFPLGVDYQDNIVIMGIKGICFEYDVYSRPGPITEITVYKEEVDDRAPPHDPITPIEQFYPTFSEP